MHRTIALFFVLATLMLPSTQWAQEQVPAYPSPATVLDDSEEAHDDLGPAVVPRPTEATDFGKQFIHMLLSLGFVLAVLLLGAWVLKRMMGQRMLQMNTSSTIKVLERRTLSPKASLYLIDVNGQGLLVGETPGGLERLGDVALAKDSPSFEEVYSKQEVVDDLN
ncbi:hypothetical protein SCG7086_BP_00050 [Chlamydiales bacterium SCGC AG-110-P3]|nr:hypothetical protein SCG7086_BP_00050 [Chlamydiales bacterium SCGC AG-110-P3]